MFDTTLYLISLLRGRILRALSHAERVLVRFGQHGWYGCYGPSCLPGRGGFEGAVEMRDHRFLSA